MGIQDATLEQIIGHIDSRAGKLTAAAGKTNWGYLSGKHFTKDFCERNGIDVIEVRRESDIVWAKVPVSSIDETIPPNAGEHVQNLMGDYLSVVQNSDVVCTLWFDKENKRLMLVDGGHRFEAAAHLGVPNLIGSILLGKDADWFRKYREEESLARFGLGPYRVVSQFLGEYDKSDYSSIPIEFILDTIISDKDNKYELMSKRTLKDVGYAISSATAKSASDYVSRWLDRNYLTVETARRYIKAYGILAGTHEDLIGEDGISPATVINVEKNLRDMEPGLTGSSYSMYNDRFDDILRWSLVCYAANSKRHGSGALQKVVTAVNRGIKEANLDDLLSLDARKESTWRVITENFGRKRAQVQPTAAYHAIASSKGTQASQASHIPSRASPLQENAPARDEEASVQSTLPNPLMVDIKPEYGRRTYQVGSALGPGLYVMESGNAALFGDRDMCFPIRGIIGEGIFIIPDTTISGRITSQEAVLTRIAMHDWQSGGSGLLGDRLRLLGQEMAGSYGWTMLSRQATAEGRVVMLLDMASKGRGRIPMSTEEISFYAGVDLQSTELVLTYLNEAGILSQEKDSFSIEQKGLKAMAASVIGGGPLPFSLDIEQYLDGRYLVSSHGKVHLARKTNGRDSCPAYIVPTGSRSDVRPLDEVPCQMCVEKAIGEGLLPISIPYILGNQADLGIRIAEDGNPLFLMPSGFAAVPLKRNNGLSTEALPVYDGWRQVGTLEPRTTIGIDGSGRGHYQGHVYIKAR